MDKTILLVEDDFFICDLYKIALTNSGYTVDTAKDGEEALQKANAQTYKLILLDIMLPKITGIDVLKSIRSEPAGKSYNTFVIVTSNLGQDSVIQTAMQLGAKKYLIKAQTDINDVVNEVNAVITATQN
jgi:DNA-binding response OmpR family regulator